MDIYTIDEIRARLASHDYSAELMLKHAMKNIESLEAENASLRSSLRYCVEYVEDAELSHITNFGENRMVARLKMIREDAQRARELLGRA